MAAPLLVRGAIVTGGGVPFSGRLDGVRRSELACRHPREPKIEMRVEIADINLPRPANDPRALLAQTIGSSSPARKRQFDQFLASPDQTGPSSATYVYRTAADPLPAAEATHRPGTKTTPPAGSFWAASPRGSSGRRGGLGPLLVGSLLLGLFLRRLAYASWRFAVTWLKSRSTSSGTAPSSTGRAR